MESEDRLALPTGQVEVWYVPCEAVNDAGLESRYGQLLTPEERERQQRFHFQRDRRQYFVARVLSRTMISQFSGCSPGEITFIRNKYGKPEIAEPAGLPFRFNLSHTSGMVVCAVARDDAIGVDVEALDRNVATDSVARRNFASAEFDALKRQSSDRRTAYFFQLWTLKEAYIKARGQGLSIPLKDFSFEIPSDGRPQISFAEGFSDDPASWQFAQKNLKGRYLAAVALNALHGIDFAVKWQEFAF
jgi:4'-phosphopantetheinyl transferase